MDERAADARTEREHREDRVIAAGADAKVALGERRAPPVVPHVHAVDAEPLAQRDAVDELAEDRVAERDGLEPAKIGQVARRRGGRVDVARHGHADADHGSGRRRLAVD